MRGTVLMFSLIAFLFLTPFTESSGRKLKENKVSRDMKDERRSKLLTELLRQIGSPVSEADSNPGPNVVLEKMAVVVPGREDQERDMTGDLTSLTDNPFVLKEGTFYHLKIYFHVQHKSVEHLRYFQALYRKGIRVDRQTFMVGSYAPGKEVHTFRTPEEEAPKGFSILGNYKMKNCFQSDGDEYFDWKTRFILKRDWSYVN